MSIHHISFLILSCTVKNHSVQEIQFVVFLLPQKLDQHTFFILIICSVQASKLLLTALYLNSGIKVFLTQIVNHSLLDSSEKPIEDHNINQIIRQLMRFSYLNSIYQVNTTKYTLKYYYHVVKQLV